jgi:pyridoxine kinase
MGDGGRFYVPEASVPAYRSLLPDCDLILPNQFELEALSDIKISTMATLAEAIYKMHTQYQLPHVFVTSTHLSSSEFADSESDDSKKKITIVGSTARADQSPRLFRIDVPYYPVYFTGTGDMLAALLVARFREAAAEAGLLTAASWSSPDEVAPTELPLAKAAEKVVASMQAILSKTYRYFLQKQEKLEVSRAGLGGDEDEEAEGIEKKRNLLLTKAVELRLIGNVGDIIRPEGVEKYKAREVMVDRIKN